MRHARSAHRQSGWLDAGGLHDWRAAYEAAGIDASEQLPRHLAELAGQASVVVSSDAPRAAASARLIAGSKPVTLSPLLGELDLAVPRLGGLRLPLVGWALAVGGNAWLDSRRGRFPSAPERSRIAEAAAWLDDLAGQHHTVIAVTHAAGRQELSRKLLEAGWQIPAGRRSMRPWSVWLFVR